MNYKCTNCELNFEINNKQDRFCPCCGYEANVHYFCTPPTEPGYYWRRYRPDSKPEIFRLFKLSVFEKAVYATDTYSSCDAMDVSKMSGEWSERIEPPE